MQALARTPATHPRRNARPTYVARRAGAPWCETLTLSNRRRLVLRPIRPGDALTLRRGFAALSPEDVRFRFLHAMTELTEEAALRLASPDPRKEFALVLAEPPPEGDALIGGVARAIVCDDPSRAEFALVLARPLRGYGLGEFLLKKLVGWARRKRLRTLVGYVHHDNAAMLALADKLGFVRAVVPDEPGLVEVRLTLARR